MNTEEIQVLQKSIQITEYFKGIVKYHYLSDECAKERGKRDYGDFKSKYWVSDFTV